MADVDPNREFPEPLDKFAATLIGTEDEVWIRVLRTNHLYEKHTTDEWRALIDGHREVPGHKV